MTRIERIHGKCLLAAMVTCLAIPQVSLAQEEEAVSEKNIDSNFITRNVDRIPQKNFEADWLTGDFNIWSGLASAAIIAAAADRASGDSRQTGLDGQGGQEGSVSNFGDEIFHYIPGTAYVTSVAARDGRGTVYMGIHNALSSGVISSLKKGVGQRRPGDQDDSSFPSGHTNTAFLGAAFTYQRYGPRWGIPSYIAAAVVGWSRIYGNKHYLNDVVGGASIAMMSSWLIVPPYTQERRDRWEDLDRVRKFSYEWEMSLNDVNKNVLQSPSAGGDVFTSPFDKQANEPWANSIARFTYRLDGTSSVTGWLSPWETRSNGTFTQPTSFGGELFPAGEDLRIAHLLWNFGALYRHNLVANERWMFRAGVGIAGQHLDQEIFVIDPANQPDQRGQTAQIDVMTWYAVAHAGAELKLGWKLFLGGDIDYGIGGSNNYADWSAKLIQRFNSKWDASVGWRDYSSEIDASEIRNDFRRSGPAFNFTYSF